MAVTITDQNFAEETASGLVLLDFWGDWCQPCKMLDPVLAQLEDQFGNQIKFANANRARCWIRFLHSLKINSVIKLSLQRLMLGNTGNLQNNLEFKISRPKSYLLMVKPRRRLRDTGHSNHLKIIFVKRSINI